MYRALALVALFGALLIPAVPAGASSCQFVLGFASLASLIPATVGACLEDQHYAANGDAQQMTSGGLLVWRKADNWTAFTDGNKTWLNGPFGLEWRFNVQRFYWEADFAASAGQTPGEMQDMGQGSLETATCAGVPADGAQSPLQAACAAIRYWRSHVPAPPTAPAVPTPAPVVAPSAGPVAPPVVISLAIEDMDGHAVLVAADHKYLGLISSSTVAPDSICNDVGPYGSDVSPTSIRNDVSPYGSDVSPLSPFDDVSSTPPMIIYNGRVVGHLTKNDVIPDAVDPDVLFGALRC